MELELPSSASPWTLGRRAEEVCVRRLEDIERRADPSDLPLRRLIRDLESQECAQLEVVAARASTPDPGPGLPADDFPSLRQRLGEAPLTRDTALYYIEALKEDAYRFFRKLAFSTSDVDARAHFTRLALEAIAKVARLRGVIL